MASSIALPDFQPLAIFAANSEDCHEPKKLLRVPPAQLDAEIPLSIYKMPDKELLHSLPETLRSRLAEKLPGRTSQRAYAHPQGYGRHYGPAPDFARKAAVMVLIYWNGEEWILPLTRRVAQGIHASQICFAGGGIDSGETDVEAAIRECREEIGWAPTKADVLGRLSPIFVYASNNLVTCVVAATRERPVWKRDPREVAEVIDVPLRHLCEDDQLHHASLERHGLPSAAPCFRWKSYDIWGATSMIISELKAVIQS